MGHKSISETKLLEAVLEAVRERPGQNLGSVLGPLQGASWNRRKVAAERLAADGRIVILRGRKRNVRLWPAGHPDAPKRKPDPVQESLIAATPETPDVVTLETPAGPVSGSVGAIAELIDELERRRVVRVELAEGIEESTLPTAEAIRRGLEASGVVEPANPSAREVPSE